MREPMMPVARAPMRRGEIIGHFNDGEVRSFGEPKLSVKKSYSLAAVSAI